MSLSDVFIRRPVFTTVLSILVILIGVISYDRLVIREYPNIDQPVVTVSTSYSGANAEIMESQVTKPLEDALSGIEGIDVMTSNSRAGESNITLRFNLDRNIDLAANDVRQKVSQARDFLPDGVDEPAVTKAEDDSEAIIYIAFSSDRHSPIELTDYARRVVRDRLQTVSGVSEVQVFGERRQSMRINLRRDSLAAYSITVQEIEEALRRQNIEIPAGVVEGRFREFTVRAETDLQTAIQFENIIIRRSENYLVRLGDVADVSIAPESERTITRYKGDFAVALAIVKQSTANPLEVSQGVRTILPEIQKSLPTGMALNIAYDSAVFIDQSIHEVFVTILEAILLVVLVIFVFLRTLRATIIPIVTIPVSLIGSFALMYLFGFSINTLTLLAFVLAIGLVVDDAIVVLENIYRYIEKGMKPIEAAFKGMREISFAVIAMTLTLAAVFAPIGFSTGTTGRLFTEFALTLAGAVLISGFVALTLSPMMCALLLKHKKKHHQQVPTVDKNLTNTTEVAKEISDSPSVNKGFYPQFLKAVLKARFFVLPLIVVLSYLGYTNLTNLPQELAPTEDRSILIGITIGPEGSTAAYTDKYMRQIEAIYQKVPEMVSYFIVVGFPTVSRGISFVELQPIDKRVRSAEEIVGGLRPIMFGGVAGTMNFPVMPPSLGQQSTGKPLSLVVQTTGSHQELQRLVNAIMAEARSNPSIIELESDLELNKPELRITVNRDKAADMGISIDTIGRTLETMIGGRIVTRFKLDGEQYNVIVRLESQERANPQDLLNIYIRAGDGQMVPLSNIVEVVETSAARELRHFNKLASVTLTANLAEGYTLPEAITYMEGLVRKLDVDNKTQIDYSGYTREFKQSNESVIFIFGLALLFIYLVLAAQFESFIDPFVIMLTVPLAMTGALYTLGWSGGTLNIYSQIGLVTLIGLITKHGILIVEFANQLRDTGKTIKEAIIESATLRLRPILMTTAAMVLGALPLALAAGPGAESRQPIGWVIVGGMTFGTLLTLFVVPAAYMLLARHHRRSLGEGISPSSQSA